jgi:hypothetical protein
MIQIAAMLIMSLLRVLMKRIWKLYSPARRRRMSGSNRVQYRAAILMLNSKAVTMGPVLKEQRFLMMHQFLALELCLETLLREELLLLIQELAAAVLIVVYRQSRLKWMG